MLFGAAAFAGLYLASRHSFLLFHSLAEGFSIVVACGVFMLAWNSRRLVQDDFLLLLGTAYLSVAVLDAVHTLAYPGMGVFPGHGTNLAAQLWIGARYVESVSLLCAPLLIRRRLRPGFLRLAYAAVTAVLLFAVFTGLFPTCFVETAAGSGRLTAFKIVSEYVVVAVLAGAAAMLYRTRAALDRAVFRLIIASIALTAVAEIAFTLYVDAYGLLNLAGHFLKIVSFYLVYRAVIATGLTRPYDLLFRSLKVSEEQARSRHDYLRNVLESIPHPFYVVDARDYTVKLANSAARAGPPTEGSTCHGLTHGSEEPCAANDHTCPLEEVKRTRRPAAVEHIHRSAEGAPRHVEVHGYPILDDSGDVVEMIEYCFDITEQKKAEEKIKDLARFPAENSNPVMRVNGDGAITFANEASGDILNVWESEAGGAVPEPWRAEVAAAIERGGPSSVDAECGDRIYALTIFPVPGAGYANLYATDVTHRRRAEDGLRQARDELERRVEERTAELRASQEQLLQSQKMEAIGRLAGGIAHDFNNMMQVVTGYAHRVMADLAPDDPKGKSVEGIKQAGERAAALTHQLLAFSRRQVLNPTVIDLNGVVLDLDGMLRRVLGEDIALVTVLDPELGRVKVDRPQIEQVIMNLAINARDAMPRGGKLTIETGNVELGDDHAEGGPAVAAGPYVMLAVSDTGCGMDEETRSRIFEPFYTTKRPGEGTGLGLSTAYGTIRESGGVMRVRSEPGRGTTFRICLPRVEEAVVPDAAGQTEQGTREGTEAILLVEDDDSVRGLVALELRDRGYTVIEAVNGAEAVLRSKLHEGPIDLLVTDVVLPDRNGREVYAGVLAMHPGVRALYISGHTENHVVHRGVLDPGTCFLAKPFTDDELAAKVREALGGAGASTR